MLREVAAELGIGRSTLSKWVSQLEVDQGARLGIISVDYVEIV